MYPRIGIGKKGKDLTGCIFGKLLVIRMDGHIRNELAWLCKCECGNECTAPGYLLRIGRIKSCGCIHKEHLQNFGYTGTKARFGNTYEKIKDPIKRRIYNEYRGRARKKKLDFSLTYDQFLNLISSNCFYCNKEPFQIYQDTCMYNGIDRVDNAMGYITDNCVTCCSDCNFAKRELNCFEFVKYIQNLYNNLKRKEIIN